MHRSFILLDLITLNIEALFVKSTNYEALYQATFSVVLLFPHITQYSHEQPVFEHNLCSSLVERLSSTTIQNDG
jgi:hypothetical protein